MEKGNSKKLYNSRIIFSVSFSNNTKQKKRRCQVRKPRWPYDIKSVVLTASFKMKSL